MCADAGFSTGGNVIHICPTLIFAGGNGHGGYLAVLVKNPEFVRHSRGKPGLKRNGYWMTFGRQAKTSRADFESSGWGMAKGERGGLGCSLKRRVFAVEHGLNARQVLKRTLGAAGLRLIGGGCAPLVIR